MSQYSIEEAQEALFETSRALPVIQKAVEEAFGDTLAADVTAEITQPPFPRSAMDGYALRCMDLRADVSEEAPQQFPVAGSVFAGDPPFGEIPEGMAVRIMTGAPIPDGADVVIPQELTDYGEEHVKIFRALPISRNCVPAGEDFHAGDTLALCQNVVDAYTVAAAVAGGVRTVSVRRRIRAAVITTGSELRAPGETLLPGQIYNSNLAFFHARLTELGCDVVRTQSCGDAVDEIQAAITAAAEEADLVLTTGGVSVGKRDYLPEVIERLGAKHIFQGIAVKPGSPTMAAQLRDTTILCLSGNPYSAIAMFEVLFPYYEQKALQRRELRMKYLTLPTVNGYPKASPKRRLVRGILTPKGVLIPKDQRNGQLHGGIGSNCLVEIPAGSPAVPAGSMVQILLW